MGGIPEARQLLEVLESTSPTERQPPEATMLTAREEYRQVQRSLTEKVLDKASSDPTWKQQLLDDPEAAVREANFPESQRLEEMLQEEAAEVRGHFVDYSVIISDSKIEQACYNHCNWGNGYVTYWSV